MDSNLTAAIHAHIFDLGTTTVSGQRWSRTALAHVRVPVSELNGGWSNPLRQTFRPRRCAPARLETLRHWAGKLIAAPASLANGTWLVALATGIELLRSALSA